MADLKFFKYYHKEEKKIVIHLSEKLPRDSIKIFNKIYDETPGIEYLHMYRYHLEFGIAELFNDTEVFNAVMKIIADELNDGNPLKEGKK